MYVDDLVSGGINLVGVENLKQRSKGGFNLHKWRSKQLFSSYSGHTKILGLGWNKIIDKIDIEIPQ